MTQRFIGADKWGYLYGLDGRLASVTKNGTQVASYQHNAFGERVSATYAAGTTHIHYGLAGRRLAESEADGDLVRGWVWLNGEPVVQFTPNGQGGHVLDLVAVDQLGQPLKLFRDQSGATVVWHRVPYPFGATYSMAVGTEATEPTRLPGQYQDPVTGVHYNYRRDYDALLGRYLTPDPIGLAGGDVNLYAYVWNNPLNWYDLTGLICVDCTNVGGPGGVGYVDDVKQCLYQCTEKGTSNSRLVIAPADSDESGDVCFGGIMHRRATDKPPYSMRWADEFKAFNVDTEAFLDRHWTYGTDVTDPIDRAFETKHRVPAPDTEY
jgi:RHS repeat-associated protein